MASVEDFLWRDCCLWFKKLKVLPDTYEIKNLPDAKLANIFRDGVLFCTLLNYLDPELDLKDFNKKPQMAQVKQQFE